MGRPGLSRFLKTRFSKVSELTNFRGPMKFRRELQPPEPWIRQSGLDWVGLGLDCNARLAFNLPISNRFERHGAYRICARKPENRENQDYREAEKANRENRKNREKHVCAVSRFSCFRVFTVFAFSRYSQFSMVRGFSFLVSMLQGLVF